MNRRIERAHANIWSFIRCIVSEESRFQHVHIQIEIGTQLRSRSNSTDANQKRINTLYQRYNDKQINAEDLLNGLSFLVAKKK